MGSRRVLASSHSFSSAIAYHSRGVDRRQVGAHGEAIEDYARAIELDPTFALAYRNRASVWLDRREYAKAIADYTRAIELKPDYAPAYMSRSVAWDRHGNFGSEPSAFRGGESGGRCLHYFGTITTLKFCERRMTDIGRFCLGPKGPKWRPPSRLGRLPLRAQVKPLRAQLKSAQARNGMCPARAHPSNKTRFANCPGSHPPEHFRSGAAPTSHAINLTTTRQVPHAVLPWLSVRADARHRWSGDTANAAAPKPLAPPNQ
jgi:hypothetical protein